MTKLKIYQAKMTKILFRIEAEKKEILQRNTTPDRSMTRMLQEATDLYIIQNNLK